MAGGRINFPPEMTEAADTMRTAAGRLQNEMDQLRTLSNSMTAESKGAMFTAFDEAQAVWQKSGLSNFQGVEATARGVRTANENVISHDQRMRNMLT